jgi:hypothetical protein
MSGLALKAASISPESSAEPKLRHQSGAGEAASGAPDSAHAAGMGALWDKVGGGLPLLAQAANAIVTSTASERRENA